MPSLDKVTPRGSQKDVATQLSSDDRDIQTVTTDSAQTDPPPPTASLGDSANPQMLSQLLSKVDNMEKALKEHTAMLARLNINQTATY